MPRHYDAFFVRHWRLEDNARRIEVIHVQTGERTLFATLPQAVAWLDTHTVTPQGDGAVPTKRPELDRQPDDAAG
jgi:hypothetical protein